MYSTFKFDREQISVENQLMIEEFHIYFIEWIIQAPKGPLYRQHKKECFKNISFLINTKQLKVDLNSNIFIIN